MARHYLSPQFDPLWIGVALARHRDAADRLVRTPWVEGRVRVIAAALLRRGSNARKPPPSVSIRFRVLPRIASTTSAAVSHKP